MTERLLVSVVMPTHNDAPYLREAIDSVLSQTYPHFEFIIVNDGSTDETEEIIKSYTDPRIRYLKNDTNRGNNFTRNRGMLEASGKYIAVMDSDDTSVPHRLETQVSYLETHPEVDILGGFMKSFSEGFSKVEHFAVDPSFLKAFLVLMNSVAQPTIMLRRELLNSEDFRYDPAREFMGDYHLWYRSVRRGIVIKSLPEVLVLYRLSPTQIGSAHLAERHAKLTVFLKERLADFNIVLPEADLLLLDRFCKTKISVDRSEFQILSSILNRIEQQNKTTGYAAHRSMKAALLFFRLRLIKYHYLERGHRTLFLLSLMRLLMQAGPSSVAEFWRNEGKYRV